LRDPARGEFCLKDLKLWSLSPCPKCPPSIRRGEGKQRHQLSARPITPTIQTVQPPHRRSCGPHALWRGADQDRAGRAILRTVMPIRPRTNSSVCWRASPRSRQRRRATAQAWHVAPAFPPAQARRIASSTAPTGTCCFWWWATRSANEMCATPTWTCTSAWQPEASRRLLPQGRDALLRDRCGARRHQFAVKMPGRVTQDRHHHHQPDKGRNGASTNRPATVRPQTPSVRDWRSPPSPTCSPRVHPTSWSSSSGNETTLIIIAAKANRKPRQCQHDHGLAAGGAEDGVQESADRRQRRGAIVLA